jgi:hypothetical protein
MLQMVLEHVSSLYVCVYVWLGPWHGHVPRVVLDICCLCNELLSIFQQGDNEKLLNPISYVDDI